jgi:hypothetical protein
LQNIIVREVYASGVVPYTLILRRHMHFENIQNIL